jgi:hypothetical protein
MKWALKNTLTDAFGGQISHNMEKSSVLGIKGKRTPVLAWKEKWRCHSHGKPTCRTLLRLRNVIGNKYEGSGLQKKEEQMVTSDSISHKGL